MVFGFQFQFFPPFILQNKTDETQRVKLGRRRGDREREGGGLRERERSGGTT
jgi:hypothetical protein